MDVVVARKDVVGPMNVVVVVEIVVVVGPMNVVIVRKIVVGPMNSRIVVTTTSAGPMIVVVGRQVVGWCPLIALSSSWRPSD